MTDPKPPNNFSCEGDSPNNDVTVDGTPVEEFIGIPGTTRGDEIEVRLDLLKNSYNRSNGDKEDIQQLLDLVAEERKQHAPYGSCRGRYRYQYGTKAGVGSTQAEG